MATLWPNRKQDVSLCSVKSGHYRNCCLLWIWEGLCVDFLCLLPELQLDNKAHEHIIVLLCFLFLFFVFPLDRQKSHVVSRSGHMLHVLRLSSLLCRGSWRVIINCLQRWKSTSQCVFCPMCFHICGVLFGTVCCSEKSVRYLHSNLNI